MHNLVFNKWGSSQSILLNYRFHLRSDICLSSRRGTFQVIWPVHTSLTPCIYQGVSICWHWSIEIWVLVNNHVTYFPIDVIIHPYLNSNSGYVKVMARSFTKKRAREYYWIQSIAQFEAFMTIIQWITKTARILAYLLKWQTLASTRQPFDQIHVISVAQYITPEISLVFLNRGHAIKTVLGWDYKRNIFQYWTIMELCFPSCVIQYSPLGRWHIDAALCF